MLLKLTPVLFIDVKFCKNCVNSSFCAAHTEADFFFLVILGLGGGHDELNTEGRFLGFSQTITLGNMPFANDSAWIVKGVLTLTIVHADLFGR